jgi:hypothetical protein
MGEWAARPDLPEFDVIVLHGIWTWVTDEDRRTIVRWIDLGCPIDVDPHFAPAYNNLADLMAKRGKLEEAERYLNRRLEQIRQASVYGVRAKRKWREAATRYLLEEAIDKDSGADDVYRLKLLDPFLGERDLHQIHDGTLTSFIAWRRQPVKVKRQWDSREHEKERHVAELIKPQKQEEP